MTEKITILSLYKCAFALIIMNAVFAFWYYCIIVDFIAVNRINYAILDTI